MRADYKRLWKLLIDRNMKKRDIRVGANLSPSLMAKLNRNEIMTTNTLAKICALLNCRIEDIMEFVLDESEPVGEVTNSGAPQGQKETGE